MIFLALLFAFLIVWVAVGKIAVVQTMFLTPEVSMWKRLLILHFWPLYWKYRYERYPPIRDSDEI